MSELARDFFATNPAMAGPMVAMFLFAVAFSMAALRAWRASPEHVRRMARLALDDESDDYENENESESESVGSAEGDRGREGSDDE